MERRLATEICYEVVAEVVDEYLSRSREAKRLLNPFDHLKIPILREGFHPPGLHEAVQEVARLRPGPGRRWHAGTNFRVEPVPSAADWDEELELPEADELIKKIFWPYPVGGLRSHQRRRARAFVPRRGR